MINNKPTYATKTTVNADIPEEEFRLNIEHARKLQEHIIYLERLQELFEKGCALLPSYPHPPSSPKAKRQKHTPPSDDEILEDEAIEPVAKHNKNKEPAKQGESHANGKTTSNHKIKISNNSNDIDNDNNNDTINPNNNNNYSNNTSDTSNNNNTNHENNAIDELPHKTRSQTKSKAKKTKRVDVLDTSLLRDIEARPEFNLDGPLKERAVHSIGYLVALANTLRLKANQPPCSLPQINNIPIVTHVQRRPFLDEKSITKYRLHKDTLAAKYELQEGDVVHMPFSKEEHRVAENRRSEAKTSEEWAQKLSENLPGRALADCTRYVHAVNSGVGYSINEAIIYHAQKVQGGQIKNVANTIQLREYDHRLSTRPNTMYKEVRRKQFPLYQQVSLSPICSGATIDVKFDPTGRRGKLLVGCAKNEGATGSNFSMLYDLKNGKSVVLDRHKDTVTESQFTRDGGRVITAGWEGALNVWDSGTGEFIMNLIDEANVGPTWIPNRLSLHHSDPSVIASCSKDIGDGTNNVILWRLEEDGAVAVDLTETTVLPGPLQEMDFSRGHFSHLLIGASDEGENRKKLARTPGWAVVFDINTGTYINHTSPHHGPVSCVRTSPCGSRFATGSTDGFAAITDIRCNVVQRYSTSQPDINVVTFSRCGTFLTAAGEDNRIFVFDSRYDALPLHILEHTHIATNAEHDGVSSTIWTNYGELLITGGEDNAIRVWDIKLARPQLHVMVSHNAPVSTLAISKDDALLASGGLDWQVCLHGQVSSSDDTLNPTYKLSQTLLSEMSNNNVA